MCFSWLRHETFTQASQHNMFVCMLLKNFDNWLIFYLDTYIFMSIRYFAKNYSNQLKFSHIWLVCGRS